MFVFTCASRLKTLVLLTTMVASGHAFSAPHAAPVRQTQSYGARQRQHNRELLWAKQQQKIAHITPVVRGNAQAKAAVRAQNRRRLEQHPEWFTPMRTHLQDGTGRVNNSYLMHITETIITHLQQQLGKPYVWGGETPEEGFDCSGLVYYAYNSMLVTKLPRTADQMYHFPQARNIADRDLRRGDLLFFRIHSDRKADHMGVYLGDGRFIESPRTGEQIRISELNTEYWQRHYLGARRVIMNNTVR